MNVVLVREHLNSIPCRSRSTGKLLMKSNYKFSCIIFCICLVPAPIVNISVSDNQTVGQSLTLQCEVIAGSGVIRTVDIVWSSDGMELERMDGVSSTPMSNSEVYTHPYTISQLSTTDDGRVIECDVTITESLSMMSFTRNITLDVTGEYYILYILFYNYCSIVTHSSHSYSHHITIWSHTRSYGG